MSTLSINKGWRDGEVLLEADLDYIKDDVEAFLNVTGISDENIQAASITASTKLIDATITAAKLAADSVITAKILNENVTAGKLASDSVITSKILNENVTAAKLASDSVVTSKILNENVTAIKLASDSVITSKILDLNVTTGKIAANAVTAAKLYAFNYALSSSCGDYTSGTTGAWVDVTNLSVTITVDASRPVILALIPAGSASPNESSYSIDAATTFQILKDGTDNIVTGLGSQSGIGIITLQIDFPTAAAHTYKVRLFEGATPCTINQYKLLAFQL